MKFLVSMLITALIWTMGAIDPIPASAVNKHKDRKFLKKMMADEAALNKDPQNGDLNYEMGIDYFLMEEYRKASGFFKKAIRLKPRDGLMRYRIGVRYARAGKDSEALSYLNEALALDSQNSLVHIEMGLAYFHLKKYDQTLKHYREAARWDPLYEEDYQVIRKQIAARKKIDALQAGLRKNPRDAISHGKLADLYIKIGKKSKAIKHYRKAVRLDPNYENLIPDYIDLSR